MTISTKKTALITGGNKGLGLETARLLAQEGFTVWIGSRDQARGDQAQQQLAAAGDVRVLDLDVTDDDSVQTAANHLEAEIDSLDVLVNNAGIALGADDTLPGAIDLDAVRQIFEVNFYGALRVTQAFLPLLKLSSAGRIVNVSSTLGSIATRADSKHPLAPATSFAYATSKTMLNSLTAWLSSELADSPAKVTSVCPGLNNTDMTNDPSGQHPSVGARIVVQAAMLSANHASGAFIASHGAVGW